MKYFTPEVMVVIGLAILFLLLGSCAALSQHDTSQAGMCIEPPEEHLFSWENQPPQLIYRYGCVYENTHEPGACCDYVQADTLTGVYCMIRFCTEDCHEWTFAGHQCPDELQGLTNDSQESHR